MAKPTVEYIRRTPQQIVAELRLMERNPTLTDYKREVCRDAAECIEELRKELMASTQRLATTWGCESCKHNKSIAEATACSENDFDCHWRGGEECAMFYRCECGEQHTWETDNDFCSCGERL